VAEFKAKAEVRDRCPRTSRRRCLLVWDRKWGEVFRQDPGQGERSLVNEMRDVRNKLGAPADPSPATTPTARSTPIDAPAVLVSAPQADEVDKMKLELRAAGFDEQARSEKRKTRRHGHRERSVTGTPQAVARGGHPPRDVASGRYQQAEFAADLWQVHLGEGTDEYKNPRRVLPPHLPHREPEGHAGRAVQRLAGHRRRSGGAACRPTSAAARPTRCWRCITCSRASPADRAAGHRRRAAGGEGHEPGCRRPTGWCWWATRSPPATRRSQARRHGGAHAVGRARLAARRQEGLRASRPTTSATSPGDALRELFNEYGPCLILVDEWVAYARQLHDQSDLPAGGFETQFSFAQA
jgi:hypothetical protein